MSDPTNPPHYKTHPSGVECIEVTEHMNFNVGNAVKYLWRQGQKGCKLEDLKKARWYIDREIQRVVAEDQRWAPENSQMSTTKNTTPAPKQSANVLCETKLAEMLKKKDA